MQLSDRGKFLLLPMPEDSPFRVSWWYRTEFHLPAGYHGRKIWLHFDGINFRANIWLNGKQIAASDQIAGTFRVHELNVSDTARAGEINTLAVEVFPALPDDLGWTWVDWNPMPPDKNMGIFRDVYFTSSGPVTLRYPQAVTSFDLPSLATAHLTVNAEAHNASDHDVEGVLSGRIEGISFSQRVKLGPQETRFSLLQSRTISPTQSNSSPRLVAGPVGAAKSLRFRAGIHSERQSVGSPKHAIWRSPDHFRNRQSESPRL